MKAVIYASPGPPDVLHIGERALPVVGDTDVLVRVAAAGVNRPDLMQRQGKYPPPPGAPDILGLEIAGTVEQVGSSVTRWRAGDQVCALVAGGGYAESCAVPEPQCLPVPKGFDLVRAAALPETYFTVWTNLFQRARLTAGERVLIHGGTSGIGTTAIQLAREFGATVIATAGSDRKREACERLGATGINYNTIDFVAAVKDITGGAGVNVVLDIVGADYLARNLECLATDGRIVQIGLLGGTRAEINLSAIMQRRATLTGSTLRPRSVAEKGAIARDLETHVWPVLAEGRATPVIDATLPLDRAAEAHRLLESGQIIGKIVLTT